MTTPDRPKERIFRVLHFLQWLLEAAAKRTLIEYKPRRYHNRLLRRYLGSLGGSIVNVSGWEDRDKEGGFYRDYFGAHDRYVLTNIHGDRGMPPVIPEGVESVFLDLEDPLPDELRGAFDVVFSHTVLEHVYDTDSALENLAAMSRDVVVTTVPWAQSVHYMESFSDYVRLSPFKLKRFFESRGFTVLLVDANDQAFFSVYQTMIVSRHPERHADAFRGAPMLYDIQVHPGRMGRYGAPGLTSDD